MNIPIIHEDEDMLVINKPSGILVHRVPNSASEDMALIDFILEKFPDVRSVGDDPIRPGIVHRLDRDTSGIMVIARNEKSFKKLKALFKKREVKKIYEALVWGNLKDERGAIDRPVIVNGERKEAMTYFRVLERFHLVSLVELYPKTGRTHQLRAHLRSIGHPILGDTLYARSKPHIDGIDRLALHARELEFEWKGKKMSFIAPRPQDMEETIRKLEASGDD